MLSCSGCQTCFWAIWISGMRKYNIMWTTYIVYVHVYTCIFLYFIIVNSIVSLTKEMLKMEGTQFILTERFTQDPLEEFFGKQRACGGRNDNPTAQQFVYNTTNIRVQKSLGFHPIRGNCQKEIENNQI